MNSSEEEGHLKVEEDLTRSLSQNDSSVEYNVAKNNDAHARLAGGGRFIEHQNDSATYTSIMEKGTSCENDLPKINEVSQHNDQERKSDGDSLAPLPKSISSEAHFLIKNEGVARGGINATRSPTFEERLKKKMQSESKPRRATVLAHNDSRESGKRKPQSESRRVSMPATFNDRLRHKLNQDRSQDDGIIDAKCENIEEQVPLKVETEGNGGSHTSISEQVQHLEYAKRPTTFEERLRKKMDSESKPRRATVLTNSEPCRATVLANSDRHKRKESQSENRRVSMPATFHEHSQHKIHQEKSQNGGISSFIDAKPEGIEQELPPEAETEGGDGSHMKEQLQLLDNATSPKTFEERLRKKMNSGSKPRRATVLATGSNGRETNEMQSENRRVSMPAPFHEYPMNKMNQEDRHDECMVDEKCEDIEPQLKMDSEMEDESCGSSANGRIENDSNHSQRSDRSHTVGGQPSDCSSSSIGIESEQSIEYARDDTASEEDDRGESQTSDLEAQVSAQTIVRAGSESDAQLCLNELFDNMQHFKQENGSLTFPLSHPIFSQLRSISNEVEPLVKSVKSESQDLFGRQETQQSVHQGVSAPPGLTRSTLSRFFHGSIRASNSNVFVQATLVEDQDVAQMADVVVAEPVGFFASKWKIFLLLMCISLALLVVLLSLFFTKVIRVRGEDTLEFLEGSPPTLSPTYDSRSTLEIIQKRGHVKCGVTPNFIDGPQIDLCRSVAAVTVGNPASIEKVPVTASNRWNYLNERSVDILVSRDTHTIEREVRESSSGSGFSFSTPYNYDGMVFLGNQTLVQCAEELKRYGECSSLMICVTQGTSHYAHRKGAFPSDHYKTTLTYEDTITQFFNNACNVMALEKSYVHESGLLNNRISSGEIVVGTKQMTKEPLAIVTRKNDRVFSDIVNWVVQALIYGEEQGLMKDLSLCHNYSGLTFYDASDLDFLNAVHCVGNYGEIYADESYPRGMNQINNGSTGMLYAIPFGNLDGDSNTETLSVGELARIRSEGHIKCGVVVPDDFEGNMAEIRGLAGMGVDYCRTLAAALVDGNFESVEFFRFPGADNSSLFALANGTIDVLVGERIHKKYDFERYPPLPGFDFSTPYYYGDEVDSNNVSFYSIATREDDLLFSSFVNCIVLATIYAFENSVDREESRNMPLVSLFGSDLNWALRDSIAYSGNYGDIYTKNFGSQASITERGRNALNEGGPLQLSLPGL